MRSRTEKNEKVSDGESESLLKRDRVWTVCWLDVSVDSDTIHNTTCLQNKKTLHKVTLSAPPPLPFLVFAVSCSDCKDEVGEEEGCPPIRLIELAMQTLPSKTATVSEGCAPTESQYLIRSTHYNRTNQMPTDVQPQFFHPIVQRNRIVRSHLRNEIFPNRQNTSSINRPSRFTFLLHTRIR